MVYDNHKKNEKNLNPNNYKGTTTVGDYPQLTREVSTVCDCPYLPLVLLSCVEDSGV